ncbi:MAG TPA: hypothetical protein VFW48_07870, partial [Solirubrobacterales bacterium]|nr:hypothetical protein [Solirubrobacterales bacterium]
MWASISATAPGRFLTSLLSSLNGLLFIFGIFVLLAALALDQLAAPQLLDASLHPFLCPKKAA